MSDKANVDMIPEIALKYIADGHQVALATVIETWGSSPRPVGAQLAIRADGVFMGSVSGGCVEGAVVAEAQEALETGTCRILEYGVSDEEVFAVGLACGGNIRVLVEPIGVGQGPSVQVLQALVSARLARQPICYSVNLKSWEHTLVGKRACSQRFLMDRSGIDGDELKIIYNPPLRMIIVGAVHIAQSLIQVARIAGYLVTLVDPRESFGSAVRFPAEEIVTDWPDEALESLGLDARTAVITLSHDPKIDTSALKTALRSDAFYIGSLGSKRTHGKRISALTELGFNTKQIARIHGPVGADIGAATPAEIALSIMAEVTERLRRPDTRK